MSETHICQFVSQHVGEAAGATAVARWVGEPGAVPIPEPLLYSSLDPPNPFASPFQIIY